MRRHLTGALALCLFSSTGFTATVTLVPSANDLYPGQTLSVDVFGSGFPDTAGATLRLTFDSTLVSVLTPITTTTPGVTGGFVLPAGSPFTGGIVAAGSFSSGDIFSVLAPLTGTLPTGNFGGFPAFRINFLVGINRFCSIEYCPYSLANIALVDDQAEFSWTDATTFLPIPVTYVNTPVPPAAFLLPSALTALGWVRRRRR